MTRSGGTKMSVECGMSGVGEKHLRESRTDYPKVFR